MAMRILFFLAILFFTGCDNSSTKTDHAKDTTGTSPTKEAIRSLTLSGTKWQLMQLIESRNNSLDQFEKEIVADLKKDISKASLSFISDNKVVTENGKDTSAFRISNDTLIIRSNKGNEDTFFIRPTRVDSLHLYFIKGIDLYYKKAQ
jgi:hypothetical protein